MVQRLLRHATGTISHLYRAIRNRSDYQRWSNTDNLREEWDERTRALAQFVPAGSRVFELGAGRCQLRHFLPAGCTYTPSDIVNRSPDTFICDLNKRPLPELDSFAPDIIVLSGVLEYVTEPVEIVNWLSQQTQKIALSYRCVAPDLGSKARIRVWAERSLHGWVNHFEESELVTLFANAGLTCQERSTWGPQSLLTFGPVTTAKC